MLLLFVVGALVPVYFMVVNGLKTNDEYLSNPYGIPHDATLGAFGDALRGGELCRWLLNSFVISAASVLLSTVIAAVAAYPIALMRWRPGNWILSLLIALMVLPPIVLVVPLFQLTADLGQLNTYRSVIVIYTGLLLPVLDLPARQLLPHGAARHCSRLGAHRRRRATCGACGRSSCRSPCPRSRPLPRSRLSGSGTRC